MTVADFIKATEGYYGKYERPVMRATVEGYLGQYRPGDLDELWQATLLQFSGRYRTQPDVAALEEVWKHREPRTVPVTHRLEGPTISDDERAECLSMLDRLANRLGWRRA
jgi:hypothetical protein